MTSSQIVNVLVRAFARLVLPSRDGEREGGKKELYYITEWMFTAVVQYANLISMQQSFRSDNTMGFLELKCSAIKLYLTSTTIRFQQLLETINSSSSSSWRKKNSLNKCEIFCLCTSNKTNATNDNDCRR